MEERKMNEVGGKGQNSRKERRGRERQERYGECMRKGKGSGVPVAFLFNFKLDDEYRPMGENNAIFTIKF